MVATVDPRTNPDWAGRFWGKVEFTETCWLWRARLNDRGYGLFEVEKGRASRAHRLAFELCVGAIPDGLVLDHLCRNRRCVRPAHLEPVTSQENVRRGDLRNNGQKQRETTHCPAGHPLSGDNLYLYPSGRKRACRTCRVGYEAAYRARRAATELNSGTN